MRRDRGESREAIRRPSVLAQGSDGTPVPSGPVPPSPCPHAPRFPLFPLFPLRPPLPPLRSPRAPACLCTRLALRSTRIESALECFSSFHGRPSAFVCGSRCASKSRIPCSSSSTIPPAAGGSRSGLAPTPTPPPAPRPAVLPARASVSAIRAASSVEPAASERWIGAWWCGDLVYVWPPLPTAPDTSPRECGTDPPNHSSSVSTQTIRKVKEVAPPERQSEFFDDKHRKSRTRLAPAKGRGDAGIIRRARLLAARSMARKMNITYDDIKQELIREFDIDQYYLHKKVCATHSRARPSALC